MTSFYNKAIIVGNLGHDPKTYKNSEEFVTFNVATSESWQDKKTKTFQEYTEWHNITIYNPRFVKMAQKYLRQGSKVLIEGQLRTHRWIDKNKQQKTTTEIVLSKYGGKLEVIKSTRNLMENSSSIPVAA